jgi:energy-coupling factor transport system ATP-binding protein
MLQVQNIAFQYPHNERGLSQFSLEVNPGEAVLVTGPSGCGKSTLARCLAGIIPQLYRGELTGDVFLNGNKITDTPIWQLSEKVGMVFQNPTGQMLAPTVEDEIIFGLENLGLEREEIKSRFEKVLAQFGLTALRGRVPQTLSGGEQQKLALAAIVAREPDVLVLDEPLSMLDSTAAADLVRDLESQVKAGRSVVVFEHRREFLESIENLRVIELNGTKRMIRAEIPTLELPPRKGYQLIIQDLTIHLGGVAVLNDVNLSLANGQLVAIMGRNGVGKTTLLRALAGLQKYAGQISIQRSQGTERPDFGLAFQNPDLQIFNPSVREEILYRLSEPDLRFYKWLVTALGLENYQDTPPLLLSEGEKNRLALAIVAMRNPAHGILLDEPSLGQDQAHKDVLVSLLRALVGAGQLMVMTTHDLGLAAQADRLILLAPDGIVADGPTEAVFADEAAWRRAGIVVPEWFQHPRMRGLDL